MNRPRSSRLRYLAFVQDYRDGRVDSDGADKKPEAPAPEKDAKSSRRKYAREYIYWLWPHRWAVGALFALALIGAGLQMVEPLFMRHIVDRVLLNASLTARDRLARLNAAGALFLALVIVSNVLSAFRDYRQRITNTRVMLHFRRALYERMLQLPLPKLWDMKTG